MSQLDMTKADQETLNRALVACDNCLKMFMAIFRHEEYEALKGPEYDGTIGYRCVKCGGVGILELVHPDPPLILSFALGMDRVCGMEAIVGDELRVIVFG